MSDPLERLEWRAGAFPGPGVYACRIAEHCRANVVTGRDHGAWLVTVLEDGHTREEGHSPRRLYAPTHDYVNDCAPVVWFALGGEA